MVRRHLLCVGLLLLLLAGVAGNQAEDPARTFLATAFKVSSAEMGRIDSGHVVVRTLGATDPREVATLGVVRIRVTPEFYAERLADIVSFKDDDDIVQIGTFGPAPAMTDVADLTLDEWDVRKLRECHVGNCALQLSADAIDRFRRDMDWQRPDTQAQADRVMRQILVEYVSRYREAGMMASMQYADQSKAMDVGHEFASLVEADVETWQHFPDLRRHLLRYPMEHTPETSDILYWSKERVSRRLVVSVTHLAISRTTNGPSAYAIASKQIYGTHYFDASLGLTILVRDRSASSPAMYLVYLNRSRVDIFDGLFGGLARTIVTTRARSLVATQLGRLQRSMEQKFTALQQRAS
jgi:hypothetical protein